MAESAISTQQLVHRLGTTVTKAILELEHSHVPANQMENGNQSCQLVNVRKNKLDKCIIDTLAIVSVKYYTGVGCDKLEAPENGAVTYTSLSIGSYAHYSCNDGYFIVGVTSRRCEASGWTDKAPICKRELIQRCENRLNNSIKEPLFQLLCMCIVSLSLSSSMSLYTCFNLVPSLSI